MNLPVSMEQVERIEVITGGASRIFGNYAYTGAINIITKKGGKSSVIFSTGENIPRGSILGKLENYNNIG